MTGSMAAVDGSGDGAVHAAADAAEAREEAVAAAADALDPSPAARRRAAGRAARRVAPRSAQARWTPSGDREDPVAILVRQELGRDASLVPLRHGRMAASPFAFYRGAAAIMAADLAGTPASGITVQLSGDAHLLNFGAYAAPDRRLVFDLDDFDETHAGPWEWDVKRLAASLVIAARDRRLAAGTAHSLAVAATGGYRAKMRELAAMTDLDAWYARIDVAQLLQTVPNGIERAEVRGVLAVAATRDNMHSFARLTALVAGQRQFVDRPPMLERLPDGPVRKRVIGILGRYPASLADDQRELLSRYRLVDVARKVVGIGSVGLAAYAALYLGRDDDDPLVLQVKEARRSVLAEHLPGRAVTDQGHRVVNGQRLMQAASDTFLGWAGGPRSTSYYVRQLADMKWSLDIASVPPKGLALFARLCGQALARAHARSGDRIAIAGYLGAGDQFDRAIAAFAVVYADRNALDLHAFQAAIANGHIAAAPG
jgi:uncharacterized protein (DUF2252 family)